METNTTHRSKTNEKKYQLKDLTLQNIAKNAYNYIFDQYVLSLCNKVLTIALQRDHND